MALIVAVCAVATGLGPHASHVDYLGAMQAKHQRLATLPSPKVVVIGGSAPAFGIDGAALEAALCRPVVNMALHADLGFHFMVQEVKDELGEGDLVIVCLEQDNFSDPEKYTEVIDLAVDRYPQALAFVPWVHRPVVLLRLATLRLQALWRMLVRLGRPYPRNLVYAKDAFDDRGDLTGYGIDPEQDSSPLIKEPFDIVLIGEGFDDVLAELNEAACGAGAQVVFVWPALAGSNEDAERDRMLQRAMLARNIPILGDPHMAIFPDSAFLDTPYHIKRWGRARHTANVIGSLCTAQPAQCCGGR